MLNFTIKKETFDKIITISAEDNEKSGCFEYNVENIPLCFNEKTKIKKISIIDYKKLCTEAREINLFAIYNENLENVGLDGWTLTFTFENALNKLELTVWCPDANNEQPETKKLLSFCKKIFALFEDER